MQTRFIIKTFALTAGLLVGGLNLFAALPPLLDQDVRPDQSRQAVQSRTVSETFSGNAIPLPTATVSQRYAEGELLVRFKDGPHGAGALRVKSLGWENWMAAIYIQQHQRDEMMKQVREWAKKNL